MGAAFGLLSGLVVAAIGYMLPVPMMMGSPPFFVNAAMMWNLSSPWTTGWVLHLFTSAVLGGIFGLLVTRFTSLRLGTPLKAVVLGLIAGAVIWFALFLPVEIPPMPGLFSMGDFMAESLGYNLVFGVLLAVLISVAVMRRGKPSEPSA